MGAKSMGAKSAGGKSSGGRSSVGGKSVAGTSTRGDASQAGGKRRKVVERHGKEAFKPKKKHTGGDLKVCVFLCDDELWEEEASCDAGRAWQSPELAPGVTQVLYKSGSQVRS